MFARQSVRFCSWLAAAALLGLAVSSWFSAGTAIAQQEQGVPLSAPADNTVPDPIGDADQPLGKANVQVVPGGAAGKQVDDTRMFIAIAIVLAIFILPIFLANYLCKALRMPDHFTRMAVVLFAVLASSCATYFEWPPKLGIDLRGGVILVYEIEQKENFKDMDKLVAAVTKRVNPDGLKEVIVRPYGEREIEIILPEADQAEQQRIQRIIQQQGQMEFRIVADDRYDSPTMQLARDPKFEEPHAEVYAAEPAPGEKPDVEAKWVPVVPEERRLASDPHHASRVNKKGEVEVLVLVEPPAVTVTGDYLTSATPATEARTGRPSVSFGFNDKGARLFSKLTGANLPDPAHPDLQRLLAIVLDGVLQSAPSIRTRIEDRGEITGNFTQQQVEELAAVLTAGSLPTTLRKEPTTTLRTGATLGTDTIQKGVYSMLVSTVAVVVFMLVYYRFAGMVANLALLLNVLLIVAFMILFHAAFTLSGLAGLALTVGMAVDANVLIYERMREELQRGATLRMAIRNGFERATTTIVDANVTTLISAVVLYWLGTDQVKGFAVTLILGIVMNLFTAITFTRLLFDIAEKQRWISRLKMLHVLQSPNFDFIGKRFIAIALSVLVIGAGLVGVAQRGRGLLDIDFTGGVSVETLFEKPQEVADIRELVKDLPDVTVQDIHIEGEPSGKRFLIITSKSDIDETNPPATGPKTDIEWVEEKLKQAFKGTDHRLAYNHLSWDEPERIAGVPKAGTAKSPEAKPEDDPSASKSSEPQKDESPQKGDADNEKETEKSSDDQQSRYLPGDENLLALADEAAQEATSDSTDTASPAEEKGPVQEKESATADGKPAAEPEKTDKKDAASGRTDPYAGGSTVQLRFTERVTHATLTGGLQEALDAAGRKDVLFNVDNKDYEKGSSRGFEEWTLKIALPPDQVAPVLEQLRERFASEPVFPSSNKVGASVAGNTQVQATYALLASLVLIVVYVWIRFQQVSFGFAAVLAVIHDVLVALGGLALSYWLAGLPFMDKLLVEPFKINLPIIAAFLTIIGYSINDTIVIFDRIREVRGKSPDLSPDLVNLCINQTLSRTLLTSLTVFIVVVILYMFGGQGIHGFAFTLVVGTISGTYSTIYIATPVLIWMNRQKQPPVSAVARTAAVGREVA
ncbi:MAG TPA: protein translocase subunit SecD [Pirellulales bacterium]|nr:protein translocase subunit SecD [Pirellulales bacterium]